VTARLFVTVPASDFKLTTALRQGTGGPVTELYFGPGQATFASLDNLGDFDDLIRKLVAAKAEFGEAQARHAARPLVPLARLCACTDAGGITMVDDAGRCMLCGLLFDAPLPDLPQREPGRALGEIEGGNDQPDPYLDAIAAEHRTEYEPEHQGDAPLIDPDCAAGKHQSCVGGPCQCACHEPVYAVPAPAEAPIGQPVCGARGDNPEDVCTASPHGTGDHATFRADGTVGKQWQQAPA